MHRSTGVVEDIKVLFGESGTIVDGNDFERYEFTNNFVKEKVFHRNELVTYIISNGRAIEVEPSSPDIGP